MARCGRCEAGRMIEVTTDRSLEVGGYRFSAELPAERCDACGDLLLSPDALERFELLAASELAGAGIRSGEAFAFMRRALGVPADELAALLDVPTSELARWDGSEFVYKSAVEIVAGLVRAKLDGREPRAVEPASAEDLLLAYRSPRPIAKAVRLDFRQKVSA
jgi:hypothetical protein